MTIGQQVLRMFLFAIPVACISWTVTHEDLFREMREWLARRGTKASGVAAKKFYYVFGCEYCFSHYVTMAMLIMTRFTLVFDDWRGVVIGGFSIVWIANLYMSLFGRLRLAITAGRQDIAIVEKEQKEA